ncbi:hypothetical protein BJY00DRAFT_318098 [Aspergillus carlsbadensis]|nr:hypothetical protein BJY00DRAFT_318098 [Aspergillus carlsbadensis]
MSLHRTLLYLLSLTSAALGSEQDILSDPTHPPDADTSSSYTRGLVSKTLSYRGNLPTPTSLPKTDPDTNTTHESQPDDTLCSASTHCLPGDYCFVHDGAIRCCPEGLACFSIAADICYAQTVYWYEEIHVHYINTDEDGESGEEVAVITEWELRGGGSFLN